MIATSTKSAASCAPSVAASRCQNHTEGRIQPRGGSARSRSLPLEMDCSEHAGNRHANVSLLFHDVYAKIRARAASRPTRRIATSCRRGHLDAHLDAITSVGDVPFLITVDDGGVSYYTTVADRLEARGWRGYCFVSTNRSERADSSTRRDSRSTLDDGHIIGPFRLASNRFSVCSPEQMWEEWTTSLQVLEDIVGHDVTVASGPAGILEGRWHGRPTRGADALQSNPSPASRTNTAAPCRAGSHPVAASRPTMSGGCCCRLPWTAGAAWRHGTLKDWLKPILACVYACWPIWLRGMITYAYFLRRRHRGVLAGTADSARSIRAAQDAAPPLRISLDDAGPPDLPKETVEGSGNRRHGRTSSCAGETAICRRRSTRPHAGDASRWRLARPIAQTFSCAARTANLDRSYPGGVQRSATPGRRVRPIGCRRMIRRSRRFGYLGVQGRSLRHHIGWSASKRAADENR